MPSWVHYFCYLIRKHMLAVLEAAEWAALASTFPYLASVLLGALTPERIQARIPGGPARSLRWQHPWLCVSPFQVSVPCWEGGDGHSCVSFCRLLCGWRERPWERAALPATWTWGPSFSDSLTLEKQHAPPPAHLARVTSSPRPLFQYPCLFPRLMVVVTMGIKLGWHREDVSG